MTHDELEDYRLQVRLALQRTRRSDPDTPLLEMEPSALGIVGLPRSTLLRMQVRNLATFLEKDRSDFRLAGNCGDVTADRLVQAQKAVRDVMREEAKKDQQADREPELALGPQSDDAFSFPPEAYALPDAPREPFLMLRTGDRGRMAVVVRHVLAVEEDTRGFWAGGGGCRLHLSGSPPLACSEPFGAVLDRLGEALRDA